MHIHGQIRNVQDANFYGMATGERAAAAQRAAETRKRLLKAAQDAGSAEASPEETLLIGQWMDSRHSQVLPGDEYRNAESGQDPDFR